MKKYKPEAVIITLILALGVVLSLIQFIYNRSLWLDEATLSLNIINKNSLELLKPLDYEQVAPILFLQIEKIFSGLWPNIEYGLRIFPLLCFWLSMYLFYRILKLILVKPYAVIFSLTLFVLNPFLIYYSSEVKQYMTDVLALTALYYSILKPYRKEENKYFLLGILGSVIIYISNAAPIMLACAGAYLLYNYIYSNKGELKPLAGIFIVWTSVFLSYYIFFVHDHPTRNIMVKYWIEHYAFLPRNPFKIAFYKFLSAKITAIFSKLLPFQKHYMSVFAELFFLGGTLILMFKKRADILLLTLLPVVLHLLLSGLKLYPFDLRLILYTCPLFIIVMTFGFTYAIDLVFTKLKFESSVLLILIIPALFFRTFYKNGFPILREDLRKSINYIRLNKKENDKVYVYYGAVNIFIYYRDINFIDSSIPVSFGQWHRDNYSKYLDEVKSLKGRNWLLFSRVYDNEESYIINGVDSLGYKKIDTFNATGSSVYLYNFDK